jgi:hypothetical protein
LRDKIGFGAGKQNDLQQALLAIGQIRAGEMRLAAVGACVGEGERTAAANLESIAVDSACGEMIDAKAGAGIVHFEELDVGAGAVFDGGIDVVGMAAGESEQHGKQNCEADLSLADSRYANEQPQILHSGRLISPATKICRRKLLCGTLRSA